MAHQPILDVNDTSNWTRVYDVTIHAQTTSVPNVYTPIPRFFIPVVFTRHTLAIGASSALTKPSWNLAFYLAMHSRLAGVGTAEVTSKFVRLGLNLTRFPPVSPDYRLQVRIPKWHREMTLTIWEYIGTERDVLDQLDTLLHP